VRFRFLTPFAWVCAALLGGLGGCMPQRLVPSLDHSADWGVEITWHGHSCFSFRDGEGRVVVIDPFDETVGYQPLRLWADVVLVTHDHFDHNNVKSTLPIDRSYTVVDSTGTIRAHGLVFKGVLAAHDNQEGRIHGLTRMYVWTMGGITLAHVGDLGQRTLTDEQKAILQNVDILFVPVGGFVTLDADGARRIVDDVHPHGVFPMHYGRVEVRFYPLDRVDPFLKLFSPSQVHEVKGSSLKLARKDLIQTEGQGPAIYVFDSATDSNTP